MYAEDDDGRILEATFTVEGDGGMIALVLSSASGLSGNRPARNPTYKDALEFFGPSASARVHGRTVTPLSRSNCA